MSEYRENTDPIEDEEMIEETPEESVEENFNPTSPDLSANSKVRRPRLPNLCCYLGIEDPANSPRTAPRLV